MSLKKLKGQSQSLSLKVCLFAASPLFFATHKYEIYKFTKYINLIHHSFRQILLKFFKKVQPDRNKFKHILKHEMRNYIFLITAVSKT